MTNPEVPDWEKEFDTQFKGITLGFLSGEEGSPVFHNNKLEVPRLKNFIRSLLASQRQQVVYKLAPWVIGNVGASSETLFAHMTGTTDKLSWHEDSPRDADDRKRCIVLLNCVPEWWDRLDEMKQYHGWASQIDEIRKESMKDLQGKQ